jgi:leucyl aminopeptidase
MVALDVEVGDLAQVRADAIVVNLFEGVTEPAGATGAVSDAAGGIVDRLVAHGDFKGKLGELAVLYPEGLAAPRLILVGLGKKSDFDLDRVRRAAALAARKGRDLGAGRLATVLHGAGIAGLSAEACGQAIAEGTILATYEFDFYHGKEKKASENGDGKTKRLDTVVIVERDRRQAEAARRGVARGAIVAKGVNVARELATLSGREAYPQAIAGRIATLAREAGVSCKVLGRDACAKLGMGSFLGVAQGSEQEPAFVVLEYKPKSAAAARLPTVVLVGKGITFDTGGISIKPAQDMDHMRFDKCGAAAVVGTLCAAAEAALGVHLIGLTPFAENMPGGRAYKPGDILTALNGKTIEVMNTDAEGRLILADALAYADRYEPDAVIDLATLTGAVSVALGTQAIGVMGNDRRLLDRIRRAGEATHERTWELPFWKEYDEQIQSKVADVKNIGGRNAGTIIGGKFLEHFVGDWPWAHLDIASTAWNDSKPEFNGDYSPVMATGVGVRLLLDLLSDWPLPRKGAPGAKAAPKAVRGGIAAGSGRPKGGSATRALGPAARASRKR